MRWAMTRAIVSVGPPAANGTFMVMGREGYVCALEVCGQLLISRTARAIAVSVFISTGSRQFEMRCNGVWQWDNDIFFRQDHDPIPGCTRVRPYRRPNSLSTFASDRLPWTSTPVNSTWLSDG